MRIPIAKEGIPFVCVPLLLAGIALFLKAWLVGGFLMVCGIFILFFFRDPERLLPEDTSLLVSPADGRVVRIESVTDPEWGSRNRISIFLTIFNVHINRIPYHGTISRIQYFPGKFLAAFRHEASLENERNSVELTLGTTSIRVTQVAGLIARRIICWKKTGDRLERGERFGMIRFGSRVDIDLPPTMEILVQVGDHLQGGSDPIARWKVIQ